MNNKNSGSGCAILFLGVIVIGFLMWGIAIALRGLGFLLVLAGPVVGVMMAVHGWRSHRRGTQVERQQEQLREIAADARRDLGELQLEMEYLAMTRGIGADLTETEKQALARLRASAESAKELLDAAPTMRNLREAITGAEEVRLRYRRLLLEPGE